MLKKIFTRHMLLTLFLGFVSGLPLAATLGTLQALLKDSAVDIKQIGLYSLVGLPYTVKFLWSPLMDRFALPFLGRRRGWMLVTQLLLGMALIVLGQIDPSTHPWRVGLVAVVVAFLSASQDIVLDAHRRDTFAGPEFGFANSTFIAGYRGGMLFSGAFALSLADTLPWSSVYGILGLTMLVGVACTILSQEPQTGEKPPTSLQEAVVGPLKDYFSRPRALEILAFILLYKLGDNLAGAMTTPFILEMGFSKTQYAAIVKTFGLISMILGGFIGGGIIVRLGVNKSLWVFGVLQALGVLAFAALPYAPGSEGALATIVAFENLSFGMGTAAYATFMGMLCNARFSATQYALLSSLMGIPRAVLATPTGYIAASLGWSWFFVFCTLAAIPGYLLLPRIAPWRERERSECYK
jgi:PAT family beta-lactamase induction signal transducer AmpG